MLVKHTQEPVRSAPRQLEREIKRHDDEPGGVDLANAAPEKLAVVQGPPVCDREAVGGEEDEQQDAVVAE